jgi:tetratricopeptide (TPR) repeat protein
MDLDDTREVCFCQFCGTKHIIKDEIVNNTTINNYGQSAKGADELIADGNIFLELGQLSDAGSKFMKAINDAPSNFRAWLGHARVLTVGRHESDTQFETAYKLAKEQEKEIVLDEWLRCITLKDEERCRKTYERLIKTYGESLKEKAYSIWTEEVKKDIADGKKFTADFYWFNYRTYYAPYTLFKIETVFDALDDAEREYLLSGIKREADRWGADEDAFIKELYIHMEDLSHGMIQRIKKEDLKNDTSPYKKYLNGIAEMRAFVGRLSASGGGAKEGPEQRKKSFWSRK